MEYISVEENFVIETFSLSHYSLCSPICDASTCVEDNPCSWRYSSYRITSQLTQGGKFVHDKRENNQIIECHFYPISSLFLHEDKSSNKISHEISPSLDLRSKEYFVLSNLVVKDVKSNKISNGDGFH